MSRRMIRWTAATAAVASAVLYYLISFGVLFVGETTTGETDLLAFGLVMGTIFLAVAAGVLLVERRWVLSIIGLFDLAVIIGYFLMAAARVPPFEVWGLAIKALQVVTLVGIAALVYRRAGRAARPRQSVEAGSAA